MTNYMKQVAMLKVELNVEERNLLSISYKNVIGARRTSWRVLSSFEAKEKNEGRKKRVKEYKQKIVNELESICNDVVDILDNYLVPASKSSASKIFFYKMYLTLFN